MHIAAPLRQLADHHLTEADLLCTEAGYFENHQRRMPCLEFREEEFLIGSDMVENGCKQFPAQLAGADMRWSLPVAQHLLPIQAAILGDHFDAV